MSESWLTSRSLAVQRIQQVVSLQRFLEPIYPKDEARVSARHSESCGPVLLQPSTGIEARALHRPSSRGSCSSRVPGESPERSGSPHARHLRLVFSEVSVQAHLRAGVQMV